VEWEVLHTYRQLQGAKNQLDNRVDEQNKLVLVLTESKHPKLDTIVELPTVNGFDGILIKVVPRVSEMETQLSNV